MADAGRSPLGLCWGGNHHAPCNIIRLGFVFFTFAKCYHKNIYCDLLPFLIASYVLKVQLSQYLFYPIRYSSFQLFLCYKMKQFSTATLSLNNKVLILDVSISIRYCHTNYQDTLICILDLETVRSSWSHWGHDSLYIHEAPGQVMTFKWTMTYANWLWQSSRLGGMNADWLGQKNKLWLYSRHVMIRSD